MNHFINHISKKWQKPDLANVQCQLKVPESFQCIDQTHCSRCQKSVAVQAPPVFVCCVNRFYVFVQMEQAVHAFASLRVPLCAIDLAPAGHRVADTRASARVHVLDHDEGMLLQRGHCQVTVIRHLLQEAAVSRPDGVAHLKDPASERTHLESKKKKRKKMSMCWPGGRGLEDERRAEFINACWGILKVFQWDITLIIHPSMCCLQSVFILLTDYSIINFLFLNWINKLKCHCL